MLLSKDLKIRLEKNGNFLSFDELMMKMGCFYEC
jgi:hypothetical protein